MKRKVDAEQTSGRSRLDPNCPRCKNPTLVVRVVAVIEVPIEKVAGLAKYAVDAAWESSTIRCTGCGWERDSVDAGELLRTG